MSRTKGASHIGSIAWKLKRMETGDRIVLFGIKPESVSGLISRNKIKNIMVKHCAISYYGIGKRSGIDTVKAVLCIKY